MTSGLINILFAKTYICINQLVWYLKISGGVPKTNKAENYDETENKPEEYEKKPKSWKNSKHEKPTNTSQNSIKEQQHPKEPSAEKEESKIYSTREFRRSNNNSGPGPKSRYPKSVATADSNPDQDSGNNEPKKSGKSYASKRKERQQQKKESAKNSDDGILDLPSE